MNKLFYKLFSVISVFIFISSSYTIAIENDEITKELLENTNITKPQTNLNYSYESVERAPIKLQIINPISTKTGSILEGQIIDFIVKEDIPVQANVIITEDDLNNTMNSSDYKRMVSDINTIGGTLNLFKIVSTSVKLKNGKMYYIMKYALPFVRKPQEIVICADLCIHNGEIIPVNTNLVSDSLDLDMHSFSKILNYINPLDFSAKILENKNARFNIQNVKVSNGEIFIDGQITVLKDKE